MSTETPTAPGAAQVNQDDRKQADATQGMNVEDVARAATLVRGIRDRLRAEQAIDLAKLFDALGERGSCKSCGLPVWWIRTKRGSMMPVSAAGVSHFADCPNANDHRKS